jgi:hypothetical protein
MASGAGAAAVREKRCGSSRSPIADMTASAPVCQKRDLKCQKRPVCARHFSTSVHKSVKRDLKCQKRPVCARHFSTSVCRRIRPPLATTGMLSACVDQTSVKRDLLPGQKRPTIEAKETCVDQTSVRRELLQGQKRPTMCGLLRACIVADCRPHKCQKRTTREAKETYYMRTFESLPA